MALENKAGYGRRINLVKNLIKGLGLEDTEITPIRWTADQPFPYNNFIYKVTFSSPVSAEQLTGRQPCTVLPLAEAVSSVIVRLSNPRAIGLNNTNRVENEVAAMHLARKAVARLGPKYIGVVPAVYAWKPSSGPNPVDETGFGWIVMEYLTGSPLNAQFKSFNMTEKKFILQEIAAIFTAIQGLSLPPGVNRFGGLTIDDNGDIISGQETFQARPGGPWNTYDQAWKHQLLCLLKEADCSEIIQGWRAHGIRQRIERFSRERLYDIIKCGGVNTSKLAFVHLDFTMSNMLYNPEENRISGVLDFDWAAISNPANEFLYTSLHDVYGTTRDQKSKKLQQAIRSGDFSASIDNGEEESVDIEAWELAKVWSEAVRDCGGLRPSDIKGMSTLEMLNEFMDKVCPWELIDVDMMKQRTAEQNARARADTEKAIDNWLRKWGI